MVKAKKIKNHKSLVQEFQRLARLWPYTKGNRKLAFIPILTIPMTALVQIGQPLMLRQGIDQGVIAKDTSMLGWSVFIFFLFVLLEYVSRVSQALASTTLVQRMILKLRHALVRHVLTLKARFHDKNLSGALVTRATSDFDNIGESLATGVLNSFVDLAVLITAIVTMFSLSWKLALICIAILPIIMLIVNVCSRALKSSMLAARKKLAALNAYTQEVLFGQQTIKLLSAEKYSKDRHDLMARGFENKQMKSVSIDAILFSLLDGIASVTLGFVLYYAVSMSTQNEVVSAGTLVAFVRLIQQMFDPLKQLGSTMAMLQGVFTSCERIFGLLDTKEFIEGKQTPSITNPNLVFKNLSFRYGKDQDNELVLKNLNFKVEAYSSLAVVGRTGSGKSTIAKLISKTYDEYEGSIQLGSCEISTLDPDYLKTKIAIVPQDVVLFDTSIKENVRLFNQKIDAKTVWKALEMVGATEFVEKLEDGIEHKLMNQGSSLSQGQRQLIAFSRALCTDPQLIILDEATSSIDPVSETLIQKAIQKMIEGRTIIIIAHRLETIKHCDNILVLEKGTLMEMGDHASLMKKDGAYAKYVRSSH